MSKAKVAPWPDFFGNDIHDGDEIKHPSGETGKVILIPNEEDVHRQWRVDYGEGFLSALSLQIGDKGQAVVVGGGIVLTPEAALVRWDELEDTKRVDAT
jgi:hypothetical protein